jgi:hypothetical protein
VKQLLLLLLFISLNCSAQTEDTFRVQKNPSTRTGLNRVFDTAGMPGLEGLIGLPPGAKLVSCQLVFSSRGEIFKMEYTGDSSGAPPGLIKSMLNRVKPKDVLFVDQIYVMKDGRKMRWPDKRYVF